MSAFHPRADLVPREVGEKWLKYFREELPTVAFKCSTQHQGSGLKQGKMPAASSVQEGLTVGALVGEVQEGEPGCLCRGTLHLDGVVCVRQRAHGGSHADMCSPASFHPILTAGLCLPWC
jgi:hypothetical protein